MGRCPCRWVRDEIRDPLSSSRPVSSSSLSLIGAHAFQARDSFDEATRGTDAGKYFRVQLHSFPPPPQCPPLLLLPSIPQVFPHEAFVVLIVNSATAGTLRIHRDIIPASLINGRSFRDPYLRRFGTYALGILGRERKTVTAVRVVVFCI